MKNSSRLFHISSTFLLGLVAYLGFAILNIGIIQEARAADYTVNNETELRDAIDGVNSVVGGTHNITFGANVTLTQSLPVLMNTGTVNIIGDSNSVNGQGAHRAFVVLDGTVNIENLTVQNALAKGGDGETGVVSGGAGGGGGLGAGGGLFVNDGADVTIVNVTFTDNKAQGGRGGNAAGGKYSGDGGAGGGGPSGGGGAGGGAGGAVGLSGGDGEFGGGGGGGGGGGDGGYGGNGWFGAGDGGEGGNAVIDGGHGGNGGFGAGGGGGGGGNGGGGGGGGAGLGGAVFVRDGGTLTILNGGLDANTVTAGAGGGPGGGMAGYSGQAGAAAGNGLYVMSNVSAEVNVTAGTQTFSGDIAGAGGLIKTGSGTMILSGTNTYSGGTAINAGTLSVDEDNNLGGASGALSFGGGTLKTTAGFTSTRNITLNAGGGTIDTDGNSLTLSGDISDTGGLTKTGSGTMTLSGNNTYSGGTAINAGILRLGATERLSNTGAVIVNSGTFDLNNFNETIGSLAGAGNVTLGSGTLTTGGNNTSTTLSGVISGAGGLTKTGTGKLDLSGDNTYTGDTTISDGVLDISGSITSDVTVNAGGTLCGIGNIAGSVTNSGTMAPGASIGTITIFGDYTQKSGSVYEVEVDAAGNSDLINVIGGTATIEPNATVDVQAEQGNYALSTDYTILTAENGVFGTFDTVTSNLAFLDPSLSYPLPGNDVILTLTRNNVDFASVGQTSNEVAVGNALDQIESTATGDMLTILNAVTGLSASQARSSYNQMGGASHSAYIATSFNRASQYRNIISRRMKNLRFGLPTAPDSGTGLSSVNRVQLAMAGGETMNDAEPLLLALADGMETQEKSNFGIWGRGYGVAGDRHGGDISSRYDYTILGFVLGMDSKISDNLLIGLGGGYSQTDIDFESLTDSGDVDSYQGTLYSSYAKGLWYIDGLLSYAFNDYDTSRGIDFGGINRTAKGDYNGNELSGYLEGGYTFFARNTNIQPLASLHVTHLYQESYTESGADSLNLAVDDQETTSIRSALGLRLAKEHKRESDTTLMYEARALWAHEFSDDDHMVSARFTGSTAGSFHVKGDRPDRDSAILGLGINARMKNNLSLYAHYDADLSRGHTANAIMAGLAYRW